MAVNHAALVARAKTETLSKTEAGYDTHGPFRCGRCEYFKAPSQCEKVDGFIRAEDCCDLFSADRR